MRKKNCEDLGKGDHVQKVKEKLKRKTGVEAADMTGRYSTLKEALVAF